MRPATAATTSTTISRWVGGSLSTAEGRQVSLAATTLPYVLFLPAYWWTPQATREACASSWAGGDADALAAARAVTSKSAATNFDSIAVAFETHNSTDKTTQDQVVAELKLTALYDDNAATVARLIGDYMNLPDERKSARKRAIVKWMSDLEWRPSLKPSCWTKRFGLWLGKPLSYDVRTLVMNSDDTEDHILEDATAKREVSPILAFGVAFSPNKYFTLLLGLTVSHVSRDASATAKAVEDRVVWASTVGFGGNLDILTSLAK